MKNCNGKQRAGMFLGMVSMALILTVTVAVSPPVGSRTVRILAWVIEKLKENPTQRTPEEIRERWRVTRPGMLLSENFVPKCEAPGLRELNEKGNGQPGSEPLQHVSQKTP